MDTTDLKNFEKLLDLMRKNKVSELKVGSYHIKMHEHDEMSDEMKAKIAEIENTTNATDEEIMFNPYAGMEMNDE